MPLGEDLKKKELKIWNVLIMNESIKTDEAKKLNIIFRNKKHQKQNQKLNGWVTQQIRQSSKKLLTQNVHIRKMAIMYYRNMERQKSGKYEWLRD